MASEGENAGIRVQVSRLATCGNVETSTLTVKAEC